MRRGPPVNAPKPSPALFWGGVGAALSSQSEAFWGGCGGHAGEWGGVLWDPPPPFLGNFLRLLQEPVGSGRGPHVLVGGLDPPGNVLVHGALVQVQPLARGEIWKFWVWGRRTSPSPPFFLEGLGTFCPPHLIKIFLLEGHFLGLEEPLVGPALLEGGKKMGMERFEGGIWGGKSKGVWGAGVELGGIWGELKVERVI